MSLAPTSTLKNQLKTSLGPNSASYFSSLSQFVSGLISRVEFEEAVRQVLTCPPLIQLHNALVISLFDASSHQRPLTPPPEAPSRSPRKRRRIWPYQGSKPEDEHPFPSRLRRWALGVGRKERERIVGFIASSEASTVVLDRGEIGMERGVVPLPERGELPGTPMPISLATTSRTLSMQHISDRVNLISAQHNLGAPSKSVAPLLTLALEAKLKQLITHALTLTSSSSAISSISPSVRHTPAVLSTSSFDTLFTLSPAVLPNQSAAALRLLSEGTKEEVEDDPLPLLKGQDLTDDRWPLLALLAERSSVKHALSGVR